jgi:HEAT repeat protein
VLEELQGSGIAAVMVPELAALAKSGDALTRADACHFLSLIGGAEVVPHLRACLADEDSEVREIAADALAELEQP